MEECTVSKVGDQALGKVLQLVSRDIFIHDKEGEKTGKQVKLKNTGAIYRLDRRGEKEVTGGQWYQNSTKGKVL